MFLKSIDIFLKFSWVVLEFSLQKLLATLTKTRISQEQKELLQLNKKTFFIILECLSFSEEEKFDKK